MYFLPHVQHVDEDFTPRPVEVIFQTPHTTKEQPHFFHLPVLVETILPYCTMISDSILNGVTKKGSDSEALNHSTKNSHSSMQIPAKRLGLTVPANWAVILLPCRTRHVTTRATSLGCHTVTRPTSNYQTSLSYNTKIIKQQNFLTMSQN